MPSHLCESFFAMNILVVSGFLGAGKTTFIQTLSEKTGKNVAVMENEYGEAGIDGALLKQDRLKVWELTEGCICCSLKSDFASSILTIANTLNPEYLIVEPTGVGLLSAVLHNISKIEYSRIQLLEPVTIADIHCVAHYLQEFGDIYADQLKNTPRILLSKIEHASADELRRVSALIRTVNPDAEILETPYQHQPEEWWKALLHTPLNKQRAIALPEKDRAPNLENISITDATVDTVYDLLELLVSLLRGYFGTVYRAKGFVRIGEQWTKFDIVDRQYTVTVCEPMPEAKAVIIGQRLDKKRLQKAFTAAAPLSYRRHTAGQEAEYAPKRGKYFPSSPAR